MATYFSPDSKKILGRRDEYSKGYACVSCGGPRSNKSKAFCKACYMKISGRMNCQEGARPIKAFIARVLGSCVHHWVYPPPNGPVSVGYCLKCGAWNESHNSMAVSDPHFLTRKAKKE